MDHEESFSIWSNGMMTLAKLTKSLLERKGDQVNGWTERHMVWKDIVEGMMIIANELLRVETTCDQAAWVCGVEESIYGPEGISKDLEKVSDRLFELLEEWTGTVWPEMITSHTAPMALSTRNIGIINQISVGHDSEDGGDSSSASGFGYGQELGNRVSMGRWGDSQDSRNGHIYDCSRPDWYEPNSTLAQKSFILIVIQK